MEKSRGRFQRVAGILKSSRAGFREELSRDGLMGWLVYHLGGLGVAEQPTDAEVWEVQQTGFMEWVVNHLDYLM